MNKKILAIDDDKAILDVVSIILQDEGYKVTVLATIDDFMAKVKSLQPALILLDILMQGNDGRDIVKQLQKDKQTASIPVVFLSANTETKEIAKEAGVVFLEKPFEIEDLLKVVQENIKA